jgi:hypothetical protein
VSMTVRFLAIFFRSGNTFWLRLLPRISYLNNNLKEQKINDFI